MASKSTTTAVVNTVIKYNKALSTFRGIVSMLRKNKPDHKVASMPIVSHIATTIRTHDVTDRKLCRAPEELQFIGDCYHTYLQSGAQYRTLYTKHYGKGEKTVQQAAATVGLKLPEPPKPE